MATTRNERRKRAKARQQAKLERLAKAELGRQADERRAIVAANLSSPRPERNFYAGKISGVYAGNSAPRAQSISRGRTCSVAGGRLKCGKMVGGKASDWA